MQLSLDILVYRTDTHYTQQCCVYVLVVAQLTSRLFFFSFRAADLATLVQASHIKAHTD